VTERAPGPAVPRLRTPASHSRRRILLALAGTVLILIAVTLVHRLGPVHAGLFVAPPTAAALLVLGRSGGLSWADLGLARRSWRQGVAFAVAAVAVVAVAYAVAAAMPLTRSAFLDARYHVAPATAMLTAFVVVPIGTVLLEEVAFRGVILGLIRRHTGAWRGAGISSALFGLWHVVPSLRLDRVNPAVGAVVGHGAPGQVAAVLAAVLFTGVAGLLFCELRRRSGSLLAAAGLHWATNGLGVIVAMVLWWPT
jgi:membrane protease YdiL (CAAX protease family)